MYQEAWYVPGLLVHTSFTVDYSSERHDDRFELEFDGDHNTSAAHVLIVIFGCQSEDVITGYQLVKSRHDSGKR
jgi:hypothetical protein